MKIIVAHPGQQHSYHTAIAVKNAGHLYKYMTMFYYKKNCNNLLSKLCEKKIKNKRCELLDDADIETIGSLLFFFNSIFLRLNKRLYRLFNSICSNYFGKRVALYAIKNNADAVIMYDTTCDKCFEILKKKAPQILRIQDVAAINRIYMAELYALEIEKIPEQKNELMQERGFVFNKKYQNQWQKEIDNSDYFIVPSKIVKESLLFSNAISNRILIIPYGSNYKISKKKETYKNNKTINILYVGSVSYMKGIVCLLKAYQSLPSGKFTLTVVGDIQINRSLLEEYKESVSFVGYIPHDELEEYYCKSDVFVFPSLGDSFGLVVLEAMSYGLPVICSDHAGASDLVVDGYNGFKVKSGDYLQIAEILNNLFDAEEQLKNLSLSAQMTAEQYSWENYYKNIGIAINKNLA